MSNQTGQLFRVTTFGESHGPAMGLVIDGCPPGLKLDLERLQGELYRRRPGQSTFTTARQETDLVEVISGFFEGETTGTPLCLLMKNRDARSKDYEKTRTLYRPGHADFTYASRFGRRDYRGGGRASARETVARVAAGAVAQQYLEHAVGIEVVAWVSSIGDISVDADPRTVTRELVDATPIRCPEAETAALMAAAITAAKSDGDTLGGCVSATARGVPSGWGAPVFDKLEADLAKGCLSLPACKGFEIGSGFAGTLMRGSEHNDAFIQIDGDVTTSSNHAGGTLGGITTGNDINIRCAFKPVSTHFKAQTTLNTTGESVEFRNEGRHDPCVLPRAVPLVEATMWLTLMDHYLRTLALGTLKGD